MKKLFLFLAFFGAVAFTSNAQSCSKTASAKTSCCAKTKAAAAKLAAADASIEAKTCAKSGAVSYYKNYTCSVSGKTTTTQVEYDSKTAKFVNVSPSKKEAAVGGKNKKSCDPAACTKKSAKAVKTSATKKSCDPAACQKGAKAVKTSAKKSCDPAACKKGTKAKMVKAN